MFEIKLGKILFRKLLTSSGRSVRLNNLAMKLNICRRCREIFQDEESQRFGFSKVYTAILLNPKSSSANFKIGLKTIHNVINKITHYTISTGII